MHALSILRRVTLLSLLSVPLCAQETPPAFAYDIATVKLNNSASGSTSFSVNTDRFQASNVTLLSLIASAYNLKTANLISGLPGWASSTHYDVNAKVDEETLARLKVLPRERNGDARSEMLRHLLEERFHLQAHTETKELPIYALVLVKGGSRLTPSDPKNTYGGMSADRDGMTVHGQPIANLAQSLSGTLKRQVEDRTGLTGNFDYTLKWSDADDTRPDKGPDLFTALQEQLGLKLESAKGPVRTVIVDHIVPPTED